MNNHNPIIEMDKQARIWASACHLSALIGLLGIPFGHIAGPLIIWLLKKNIYSFVKEQGIEALNFQLSMTIYALVAAFFIHIRIGMLLLFVIAFINAICIIFASIRAYQGGSFYYPFKIQIIKSHS